MGLTRRAFLKTVGASGILANAAARLAGQGMSSRHVKAAARPKFSGKPWPVSFTDVAPRAGLTTSTIYGDEYKKRYIVEANGPGIAFFDYDHDGWLDVFVPSGTRLEGFPSGQAPTGHLYHNNRDGTFT